MEKLETTLTISQSMRTIESIPTSLRDYSRSMESQRKSRPYLCLSIYLAAIDRGEKTAEDLQKAISTLRKRSQEHLANELFGQRSERTTATPQTGLSLETVRYLTKYSFVKL